MSLAKYFSILLLFMTQPTYSRIKAIDQTTNNSLATNQSTLYLQEIMDKQQKPYSHFDNGHVPNSKMNLQT